MKPLNVVKFIIALFVFSWLMLILMIWDLTQKLKR